MTTSPVKFDVYKATECLVALGHHNRLEIFRFLIRGGQTGKTIGEIQKKFLMPPSTLSHHIKTLENVHLIERDKQGTTHHCTANFNLMLDLVSYLFNECCADRDSQTPHNHILHQITQERENHQSKE